jgi:hypothetical protein
MIFLLLRFVFSTEDKCPKIAALEIIDDYPFDLRFECSQDACEQIMGERSLLLCALHEHRGRRPNALLNANHENLLSWRVETVEFEVAGRPADCSLPPKV